MKVWKITQHDSELCALYLDNMAAWDGINGNMEAFDVGDKYTIEVVEMDEQKFKDLPEWDGF